MFFLNVRKVILQYRYWWTLMGNMVAFFTPIMNLGQCDKVR